jgi:hypothetical protein
MTTHFTRPRLTVGAAAIALLLSSVAGPALGIDTVTQTITGGGLTASIGDLSFPDAAYQNGEHTVAGTMVLTAADDTGTSSGWKVTVMTSDFAWTGTAVGGQDIPATAFALTSAEEAVMVTGQAVGVAAATGPQVPPTSPVGTLDTPRQVLYATAAYGAGSYTQNLNVALTIPALSRVGTYTGTLTTTITAAP